MGPTQWILLSWIHLKETHLNNLNNLLKLNNSINKIFNIN